jgi:formate hydrogenlyase subunit 4
MLAPLGLIQALIAFLGAPLLVSVIQRTKAVFAGRRGQPWLQPYFDLWKLLHKSTVFSRTTTSVFALGPILACSAAAVALVFIPLGGWPALISFPGDFLFVAYLLGLIRFFTVSAAMDTGSSFEGMGASREVLFSSLAEPALLLAMATLVAFTHSLSLSGIYAGLGPAAVGPQAFPAVLLAAAALMVVFLAENARIPFDDPNTHLELTMIHEVMVLDHSGPDFAMIQYGACLKIWILGSLVTGVLMPVRSGILIADLAAGVAAMTLLAAATGVVESVMARLRLVRVPQLLVAASILSIIALVLVTR